jgi:cation transport ATPase
MIHTYKVTGMTCSGCKASVEEKLATHQHIKTVFVDLENAEATLEMSSHLPLSELQDVLTAKYQISEKTEPNIYNSPETVNNSKSDSDKRELKQLFPLFLIFGYIVGASILLNVNPWNTESFMLDFMGLFYIVFSFFKFLDLKSFPQSFRMYDPLAKAIPDYAWIYPFVELTLGIFFLMRFQITLSLIVTVIILGITTVGVTKVLFSKQTVQCACLGTALKLPMTKATFIENSIMIVMAVLMLTKTFAL